MSDNIKTKDRLNADLDIASKDIGGVQVPRNMLVDPSGNDITPLTDAQLRASELPVSASSLPLPTGAATETTLEALRSLANNMSAMNEGMQYLLGSILEKLPRVDAADRVMVSHAESNPTVNIATNQDIRNVTGAVASITAIGGRDAAHAAYALANAGALHIYDNIRVS